MREYLSTNNPAEAANFFLETMKELGVVDDDLTLPAFLLDLMKTDLLKQGVWTNRGNDPLSITKVMYAWIMGYAVGKGKCKNPHEWKMPL